MVVVGGGNSAAQILAEISTVAGTSTWVTRRPPRLLPDEVDGRALFDLATRRHQAALAEANSASGIGDLGDIVAVPAVREARDRGALKAEPMFSRITAGGVAWSGRHRAGLRRHRLVHRLSARPRPPRSAAPARPRTA